MQETQGPGFHPWVGEDSLEKGMATRSSILTWKILWTEEPGVIQTIGLQRIRQDCSDLAWHV